MQRQAKRSNRLGDERYDYDALMNLAQSDGQAHRYEGDCITRIGNTSYRHDARGRVIEKTAVKNGFRPKTWHYLWDDFDRLIETHTPDGSHLACIRYDAFGRRIKKECIKAGEFVEQAASRISGRGRHVGGGDIQQPAMMPKSTRWHFEPGTFNPLAKETYTRGKDFYPDSNRPSRHAQGNVRHRRQLPLAGRAQPVGRDIRRLARMRKLARDAGRQPVAGC